MAISEKKLEQLVQIAITDHGLDDAANRIRREAASYRRDPKLVQEHGLDPKELDECLLEVANRLDKILSDRRKNKK